MEVKIDSNLIRTARENRGWSQEHLASVAGLSLRTIQRIEKTGSASFESVTALASVLSLDVEDLRVAGSVPARGSALHLSLELPMRLALAAVSGVLCALHYHWRYFGPGFDLGFEWFDYAAAGTLFGVTVLWPYLRPGHGFVTRALGLTGASALSYFCAVNAAMLVDMEALIPIAPELWSLLLASLTGVIVVLVSVKLLIPLRVGAAFWRLGIAVSLVGGAVMYAGFYTFDNTVASTSISFCAWHMLACLAIYLGHDRDESQRGVLAEFAKTRSRFSIVPGWLRLSHLAWG